MAKLTILVGTPGAGKTFFGNSFKDAFFLDDLNDKTKLESALKTKNHIIIADVFLCREKDRAACAEWLKGRCDNVEWIFFENAPEKCRANVIRRMLRGDARKVFNLIEDLSKVYIIPENAKVVKVYSE